MHRIIPNAVTVVAAAGLLFAAPVGAQSVRVGVAVASSPAQYPQGYPGQYPGPAPRTYPNGPYSRGPGVYGVNDYAYSNGFRDGYDKGIEDARGRRRFDPRRHRWYRNGDRGYERSYRIPRPQYENVYRQGFLRGYEDGFRDAQRGASYGRGYGPRPTPHPTRRGPNWGGWLYFRF